MISIRWPESTACTIRDRWRGVDTQAEVHVSGRFRARQGVCSCVRSRQIDSAEESVASKQIMPSHSNVVMTVRVDVGSPGPICRLFDAESANKSFSLELSIKTQPQIRLVGS